MFKSVARMLKLFAALLLMFIYSTLFSDLYLVKFLDISTKLFFLYIFIRISIRVYKAI